MKKPRRRAANRQRTPGNLTAGLSQAKRLRALEDVVTMLLQALLRGHLLPSERKPLKQFLEGRKRLEHKERKQEAANLCPACRVPLQNPKADRCPWCSVLLRPGRHGMAP